MTATRATAATRRPATGYALERGADIVIMLHADYQYSPKLLLPMAYMLSSGFFDVVLGSRILGIGALTGGMPLYKYVANRTLTLIQNMLLGHKLSEYHTGYRGFTRAVIEALPLARNSDDFIFDNQMLAQAIYRRYRIGEISCPTKYFPEASSINFRRSVIYGLGVLRTSLGFRLARMGFARGTIFEGLQGLMESARQATRSARPLPLKGGGLGWGSREQGGQDPHPAAIASQAKQSRRPPPFRGR